MFLLQVLRKNIHGHDILLGSSLIARVLGFRVPVVMDFEDLGAGFVAASSMSDARQT